MADLDLRVRAVIFPANFPPEDRRMTLLALTAADTAWATAVRNKCVWLSTVDGNLPSTMLLDEQTHPVIVMDEHRG